MRNKVRKSLAFLLALALVVSVMSGLGLSVSADETTEPVSVTEEQPEQEDQATDAAADAPAEEEEPAAEPVGEGSGKAQQGDTASEQKEEPTLAASEDVQTATVGSGDKTVTVTTTAAAGVLPEGAKLVVKQLEENGQAYQSAADELDASKITYDGFLALDVGFQVNGQEVEPNGAVDVQFQLGAGLLPEELDADTLAVQHHDASEGVETVADATAVTVSKSAVKADFEVKSFSTFTVTWKITSRLTASIELYAATRADTSSGFTELFGQTSVGTASMNASDTEFVFANHKGENITYGGKTYQATGKAYILINGAYKEVTSLKKKSVAPDWLDRAGYVIYAVGTGITEPTSVNDSSVVWYGYSGNWSADGNQKNNKIYLEYNTTPDSGDSGSVTVDVSSLSHEKYITKNNNGTYDLTLTVAGATGSSTKKREIDVLLIVDKSGSMRYNLAGTNSGQNDDKPYSGSRWEASKNAIQELIDNFDANKDKLDVKYSIVTFSGSKGSSGYGGNSDTAWNDAEVNQEWAYSSAFTISTNSSWSNGNGILDFTPSGGTNYAAGFRLGKEQLKTARSTAQKVVIFLSDGEPTYYYNSTGMTTGAGDADADAKDSRTGALTNAGSCSEAAYAEAKGVTNANYFYTIGLGNESAINKEVLKKLSETVAANSTGCTVNKDHAPFMCSSLDDLKKAFDGIKAEVEKFACTNVVITDYLSDNVDIVEINVGESNPYNFRISMKKANGTAGTVPAGTTASYDAEKRTVTLQFPENYELEAGATYSVTFTVEPSDLAYQKYAQSGGVYTDTGEEGTGVTSAGQEGYFSNTSANVSYKYKGENRSEPYKKPVVQVSAAMITVTKNATGLPDSETNKEFTFTISSNNAIADNLYSTYLKKGSTGTVNGKTLTLKNGQSATFVYKAGTTMTFTENQTTAKVDGYNLVVSNNGVASGSMTANGTNLTVTNTYTKATQDLTITKAVSGADNAYALDVSNIAYTFTITPATGVTVEDGTYGDATFSNNVGTVTITGTGTATVDDLPIGAYTVTETGRSGEPTGYDFDTTSGTTKNVTLTTQNAGAVTITNNYQIKTFTVTVKKLVQGNSSSDKDLFGFSANDTTFSLKHNGTKNFTVKYNTSFTAEETDKNGYTLDSVEATGSTGTQSGDSYTIRNVTADTTITFTNDKTIQSPTGVTRTIAPFVIMAVLAAGAGVYFVYSRRQRD